MDMNQDICYLFAKTLGYTIINIEWALKKTKIKGIFFIVVYERSYWITQIEKDDYDGRNKSIACKNYWFVSSNSEIIDKHAKKWYVCNHYKPNME